MKNMSLNGKVWSIILLLATAAITISYFGITGMQELNNAQKALLGREIKADAVTFMMIDFQRQTTIAVRDIIIARTDAEMDKFYEQMLEARKGAFEKLSEYKLLANPEGKRIAEEYERALKDTFDMDDVVIKVARENKDDEVRELLAKAAILRQKRSELMTKINNETASEVERATKESEEAFVQRRFVMILLSVISISTVCLVAFMILRALSKTIEHIIHTLTDNSIQVTSAATQISSASQDLSQATTEQATSVQQTTSSLTEINSMVQQTSDNAKKSHEYSNGSHSSANRGKIVVEEMMKAISAINESNDVIRDQIDESNKQISDIVKVIAEIESKTKVINDIVFQTKLLSFNASVEAARAGAHGQGFAVVAEEVGNLATMSGKAAEEISTLLDNSIKKVESIVEDTKSKVEKLILNGKEKINHGTKVAKDCKDVLDDIVLNVSSVNSLVSEITAACSEQSKGVKEITSAVTQLDQVTQQNAATSEESANAAEELASQASALQEMIQLLAVTIQGGERIEQKGFTSKPVTSANKVLPFKASTRKTKVVQSPQKKVSGLEFAIPHASDSRFEEL